MSLSSGHLDYLLDEMCLITTQVGLIAHRQAHLGGFAPSPSPSLEASIDEDDDDAGDNDASSSGDDDLSVTCLLSFVTKRGSSFGLRVVLYLGGELV